jgi:uncharacterized repeat protein (TIGR01451 family)
MKFLTLTRALWRTGTWMALLPALWMPLAQGSPGAAFGFHDAPDNTGVNSTEITIPANIHWITVELWAGGGSGGAAINGSSANPAKGGGGAGGQYARKTFRVVPGQIYTVKAGGHGGATTGDGESGKDSSFGLKNGAVIVLAKGGQGGKSSANGGAGGKGTSAGGLGDVVYRGGDGSSASSSGSGAGGGGPGGDKVHLGSATVCGTAGGNGKSASDATPGSYSCYCGGSGGKGNTSNGATYAPYSLGIANATLNCVWGSSQGANSDHVFSAGGGGAYKNNSGTEKGGHGGRGRAYVFWDTEPITLTKMVSSSSVSLNEIVSFTLRIKNNIKDPLRGLEVRDVLPAGMVYVDHDPPTRGAVAVNGNTLTWTMDLPVGASESLRINVRAVGNGILTNVASAPGAKDAKASVRVVDVPNTHFRMDESVASWSGALGDVIDSGGAALHGKRTISSGTASTATNVVDPSPTIDGQHSTIQGAYCNAGSFDGKAYIEVPHNPRFDYTDRMSASVWIYVEKYPASDNYGIFSNEKNYEFLLGSDKKVMWWWWDGSEHKVKSNDIPLKTWTHVALTLDMGLAGKRQKLYVNGVEVGSLNHNKNLLPGTCPFLIGSDVDNGCNHLPARNFVGMIDEVKLYDYALTADEVKADMELGRQCAGVFDHIRIEHSGSASSCSPETVTVKACLNPTCSALYRGNVTAKLSPSGIWEGGDIISFHGGQKSVKLRPSGGSVTLGTVNVAPSPDNKVARCFSGSTESCQISASGGGSCEFDAVEVGANTPSNLFTKRAGVPFSLDILAIDPGTKQINSNFTGNAKVELIDASNANCVNAATLNLQTVTYSASDKGRKRVDFAYGPAARKVRVRAKADVSQNPPSCSGDAFTIRPSEMTVSSSANADPNGTNPSATPTVKTGAAFSLFAQSNASNYDGTPKLDPALIEWTNAPAGVVGVLNNLSGQFSFSPSVGNNASGQFTYDETGYFRFKKNGVYDDAFTEFSGDKASGDCVAGSFENSLVNGKYGCNFGNVQASNHFGRFIPDHFDTSVVQACPSGGFTYSGQPFNLTVTAKNSGGNTSLNYMGSFARNVALTARDTADTTDNPGPGQMDTPSLSAGNFTRGVGQAFPAYTFTNKETFPISVRLRANDTELSSSANEGLAEIRSGRATLGSIYGPEQVDLAIPFRAEYFSPSGWTQNTDDACTGDTSLNLANGVVVILTPPQGLNTCVYDDSGLSGSAAVCTSPAPAGRNFINGTVTGFDGDFNLWLKAPQSPGIVHVDATVPYWLAPVSSASATFGRNRSPVIYRRENY